MQSKGCSCELHQVQPCSILHLLSEGTPTVGTSTKDHLGGLLVLLL